MPLLSRQTGKLLSRVNGRAHATQDDHLDVLPTPPATSSTRCETEEDIQRDPESSDEESPATVKPLGFKLPRQIDGGEDELPKPPNFIKPIRTSPGSTASKRSNGSDHASSDNDFGWVSSQSSSKRQRTSYGGNIHAPSRPRPKQQTYGKSSRHSLPNTKTARGFKKPRTEISKADEIAPAPVFKAAKGADMFEFGSTDVGPGFKVPRQDTDVLMGDGGTFNSLSPSLSSLSSAPSSPDVEEIKDLNLPAPQPYAAQAECAICGKDVDLFLKQEFEDEFTQGGHMSYKWQQRFCRYHKQHEAKELWKQKGYPEIDWDGLEKRMRRHHSHLEDIMSGAKPSHYRGELHDRLKSRSKTVLQTVHSDETERGGHVGYYGPRGEKAMTDHIIAHLSDSLRKQATKDKLVAASGVSGGVSGFVQTVLVPELAEQLVREDMKVSGTRAREIVADSAELGDLLNPEVDDKVTEVVEIDE